MADQATLTKPTAEETAAAEQTRSGRFYRPAVDIREKADELLVLADVPGVRQEEIDIHFEDGMLTIHARVHPRRPEDQEYLLQEYGIGDFYRTFQVNETIDASQITAEYASGVLTLHLPKAESAKPRKIPVKGL